MTPRAAIYTRVSQDASGVGRSPREQEAEARKDCERQGWPVVEVYTDNDRSASRHARKTRPDYARLLADIAAGAFDVLVTWEASRLTRDLEAYATLAAACRAAGVRLSYNGRTFDLDNADDEFNVGLDMLLAQRESGVTRKRILRNVAANAAAGRPHGKTPFGYRRIYDGASGRLLRQEPDPVTAPLVVELFTRVADGDPLQAIARNLNARGIRTRQDTTWTATKVRQTVESKTHLGHRTHKGAVTVENAWPAIVDDTLYYRVAHILSDPDRRTRHDVGVQHLMSGLLRCERCGSLVGYSQVYRTRFPVYRCRAGGHVAIKAPLLDEGVRELIVAKLSLPDCLAAFTPPDVDLRAIEVELVALRARLDEADEALVAGALSARAHGVLEARVRPRIDDLARDTDRARAGAPAPLGALGEASDVAGEWDRLNLAQRRLVVRGALVDCELRAAPASRRRQDLGLRYRWAGVGPAVEA